MAPRDPEDLPFPKSIGPYALFMNGAKGGATKYLTLQYLNYARWTAQHHSVGILDAIRIVIRRNMYNAEGHFHPLGLARMWAPHITILNEAVHWGIKVPTTIGLYDYSREMGFGPHSGLFLAVVADTCAEVAFCGWSERFGVHMGLNKITSYSESLRLSVKFRGSLLAGLYAGSGGLWVRNFFWNITFFEWKRFFHNSIDQLPEWAPSLYCRHIMWLRGLDVKDQANILTFEAATLATYLTFFNMAGDNVKTKMSVDPQRYPTFIGTCKDIWASHGVVGFARGSLFKGIYLILGATVAIGIQERLSAIMASFVGR
mmetsp:Transcript_18338/g.39173  ORF Transcript_18338/g.39173 Transcript_18338/m.39173 type:complete len:315 (+) Transcript_18338:287-1231(+)|eukprot:CAMPEP_0206468482 /NCGR_PEP_ID=MMETSP0324_2-20121206/29655_1 /ASSEMBLY_ACC=CAM_ASM_000836 /TAXON_ID=2866 /ORGANISM="Crypthecodinium cohnii, Strain Seligo" /LENGTH=314 /DNA_ID=CAMNT_0053941947 /DNA_START=213 /DNA_END=1157 /DNA_ORIENTATION=+